MRRRWADAGRALRHLTPDDIGGRLSASFLKPALGRLAQRPAGRRLRRARQHQHALLHRLHRDDGDMTAALRHRFSDTFLRCRPASKRSKAIRRTRSARSTIADRRAPAGLLHFDTTDNKLDPTRRLSGSTSPRTGFPTFLGSTLNLAQGDGARLRLLFARFGLRAMCSPAASRRAPWRGRRWTRFPPTGASMPAAAARCAAMPMTRSVRPARAARSSAAAACLKSPANCASRLTDTIGVVPFFDAGNAFASSVPNFSAPLANVGGSGLALFHRHRAHSSRRGGADQSAAGRPAASPSMSASGRRSDARWLSSKPFGRCWRRWSLMLALCGARRAPRKKTRACSPI